MDDEYRGRSIGAIIGVHREQNGNVKNSHRSTAKPNRRNHWRKFPEQPKYCPKTTIMIDDKTTNEGMDGCEDELVRRRRRRRRVRGKETDSEIVLRYRSGIID